MVIQSFETLTLRYPWSSIQKELDDLCVVYTTDAYNYLEFATQYMESLSWISKSIAIV
jgi:hypothetical protein